MSKDRMIGVRVDASLEEKLRLAAAKQRRPLGQYVRNALADAVDRPTQTNSEAA